MRWVVVLVLGVLLILGGVALAVLYGPASLPAAGAFIGALATAVALVISRIIGPHDRTPTS
jgi:hypothetical protein